MFLNLASKSVFVIKLVISGILFLTAVNDELIARPLILGILPSTSVILESKSVFFLTKLITNNFFIYFINLIIESISICTKFSSSNKITSIDSFCFKYFYIS